MGSNLCSRRRRQCFVVAPFNARPKRSMERKQTRSNRTVFHKTFILGGGFMDITSNVEGHDNNDDGTK